MVDMLNLRLVFLAIITKTSLCILYIAKSKNFHFEVLFTHNCSFIELLGKKTLNLLKIG